MSLHNLFGFINTNILNTNAASTKHTQLYLASKDSLQLAMALETSWSGGLSRNIYQRQKIQTPTTPTCMRTESDARTYAFNIYAHAKTNFRSKTNKSKIGYTCTRAPYTYTFTPAYVCQMGAVLHTYTYTHTHTCTNMCTYITYIRAHVYMYGS